MEFEASSDGNSGDERRESRQGNKSNYHRHDTRQIQILEAFFKENPHPDESERRRLGEDLGLDPKQIKFWFQNKRTQIKTQIERADNAALKAENERIQCENLAIREALKKVNCPDCGGPAFGEEERRRSLRRLLEENAHLREQHENLSTMLANYIGQPIHALLPGLPMVGPVLCPELGPEFTIRLGIPMPFQWPTVEVNDHHHDFIPSRFTDENITTPLPLSGITDLAFIPSRFADENITTPFPLSGITDLDMELIFKTVSSARDELIQLIQTNEPLWVKSSSFDERYVIHGDIYDKNFPRSGSRFKSSSARVESSKDLGMVAMSALQLVDMLMDPEKCMDIFPTIVSSARTIQVIEPGMVENKNGCLQLMYQQIHILSPLVSQREYYFLRFCQQIEPMAWVIVDVSYEWPMENVSPSRSWRLPSGCMIRDMSNGCSHVTWVEHVEVDDDTSTHPLYRDLIYGGAAYGAERWIATLQRMSERLAYYVAENAPSHEVQGEISLPEGKRSIMRLAHRMVRYFCEFLGITDKNDFPAHFSEENSGVRISVRKNIGGGQPFGTIVSAATSLWLPLQPEHVFNFCKDVKMRKQWDVLAHGNVAEEVVHISNSAHPGNCISIIQPSVPTENSLVILQESCIDRLGSMVAYAPLDATIIRQVAAGEESSEIAILPSGFVISGDGRPHGEPSSSTSSPPIPSSHSGGCLLTVAFQILIPSPWATMEMHMDAVASVNTLVSSTVQRIKAALDCSDLE